MTLLQLGHAQFQSTLPTRGSDLTADASDIEWTTDFNPRSPRGGATAPKGVKNYEVHISIHAPHEGERRAMQPLSANARRISIHAPHEGERPAAVRHTRKALWIFQSTLPTRGSDNQACDIWQLPHIISIHAPHEGERLFPPYTKRLPCDFNPRSPRGGAT